MVLAERVWLKDAMRALVLWTNCLTELFHFRELNLLQVMATWAHNQRGYSVLETCLSASYHSSTYGVVAGSGRRGFVRDNSLL
jgi:hypothetical protein